MTSSATTVQEYLDGLAPDRKLAMQKLREALLHNLPDGFSEGIGYGMIGYSRPHSIYPDGYHCKPSESLPFISIASQKNFIALHHMGMYMQESLLQWFRENYPKQVKHKLDMGKACVRFKKIEEIPYALIGELATKMTVKDWITCYEKNLSR